MHDPTRGMLLIKYLSTSKLAPWDVVTMDFSRFIRPTSRAIGEVIDAWKDSRCQMAWLTNDRRHEEQTAVLATCHTSQSEKEWGKELIIPSVRRTLIRRVRVIEQVCQHPLRVHYRILILFVASESLSRSANSPCGCVITYSFYLSRPSRWAGVPTALAVALLHTTTLLLTTFV